MPVITGDAIKYNCIKPYVPSVPEKGHKETEQIQIRRRVLQNAALKNAASDQELQFAYSSDLIIPGLVTNGTAKICCLGLILTLF